MSAMEIPIFENEAPVGTLRVFSQGLYTVFQTRLPAGGCAGADSGGRPIAAPAEHREAERSADPELTRLWLIGKCGAAAPLGLLRQEKGGRSFCRRLSRMECQRLPKTLARALVLPNGEAPGEAEDMGVNGAPEGPSPAKKGTHSKLRTSHSEFAWRPLSDGSLIEPGRRLLALPWGGEKLPLGVHKILRNGKEYWVFRY